MIVLPLPPDVVHLLEALQAPRLLVRHLVLVHHTAAELLDALAASFPGLVADRDAVLYGASVHDIGKLAHPCELTGPGSQHEEDGPGLLIEHGIPPRQARFARSHGRWREADDLEDLLVAIADHVWCGRRVEELEMKTAAILAMRTGQEQWEALLKLDAVCEKVASKGEERLAAIIG